MEFMNKITVITPESFNEFLSENENAVLITGDRTLSVTETIGGTPVRIKIFAPGQWLTVESELVEVAEDEGEEIDLLGI